MRKRNEICPRCKVNKKIKTYSYCQQCRSILSKERYRSAREEVFGVPFDSIPRKKYRNNKSGETGIYYIKKRNFWIVNIKRAYVGAFYTMEEAVAARKAAIERMKK